MFGIFKKKKYYIPKKSVWINTFQISIDKKQTREEILKCVTFDTDKKILNKTNRPIEFLMYTLNNHIKREMYGHDNYI